MNAQQVAAVVAKIRLGDNRETSPEVILEWLDTIGDLNFDDAVEAVRMHRRESVEYLVAAHVRANVKRIQLGRQTSNDTSGIDWASRGAAPQPANMGELSAAWDDADAWGREVAVYDEQLRVAGFMPVGPIVHGSFQPSSQPSKRRAAA